MFYYQTFVNEIAYKGDEALTYASDTKLSPGTIVLVPLKQEVVNGFILKETAKPPFKTRKIHEILPLPSLPPEQISLASWMTSYYPAGIGVVAQHFLPKLLTKKHQLLAGSSLENQIPGNDLPELTEEQVDVVSKTQLPGTYILHGETGSGKTRVYIELAKESLKTGRSVIVLTPEIGLTPQLFYSFEQTFGTNTSIILTHSQLTESQRRKAWLYALQADKPIIVMGPRSALFTPTRNIGLIIVDESHETSYKQDQMPHYHASKIAAHLAKAHDARLILGSATPSITDYYLAQQHGRPILRMIRPARGDAKKQTKINVIDIKDRSHFARSQYISNELIGAIGEALAAGQQSLLFLNRRGTARTVLCQQCGWQALCPHCDLPLTYHGDVYKLRCHTCGHAQSISSSCPVCKSADITLKSIGTKAVYDEIAHLFPHARVQRFDADNKKTERIEQNYDAIRDGSVDILVGTQLLAKGFDLPNLSVVGVVIADTSLYFPDYSAQERTYQLMRQVIGRVGRGHREDTVIIQTYDPDNFVVKAAMTSDWASFYKHELEERQRFVFPPYCFLLKMSVRRASDAAAQHAAEKFVDQLKNAGIRVAIDGPTPSFHEKVGNKYQWQVVLKAKDRKELLRAIKLLPSGWSYDIDPLNLL